MISKYDGKKNLDFIQFLMEKLLPTSKENTIIMPESGESKAKNHLKPDITNLFSSQATLTLGVVTRIVT